MTEITDRELTRRRFLQRLGLAALATPLAAPLLAAPLAAQPRRRRLLVFSKSSGFEHGPIKRGADGAPALAERVLTELGAKHGFDVTCTKDGSVFTRDGLRPYDAFLFYTSGYLTEVGTDKHPAMPPEGKQALLDAVAGGKGFVAIHSASDSFHTLPDPADRSNRYVTHGEATDPYLRMLGGEFILHGKQQTARVRIVDEKFPGMDAFGGAQAERMGEWYSLKEFAPDLHVLMVLETEGMTGAPYARPPFPVTWARAHGRGRVFYSALGHREDEWTEAAFPAMLVGALRWAFGDAPAALGANLRAVAPRAGELPPREG